MKIMKKNYPILSPVQIVNKKKLFEKKTEVPGFSEQIYYIYYIKRPILSEQTFLFKLVDRSGKILPQAFSIFDIKKTTLESPDKFVIRKDSKL